MAGLTRRDLIKAGVAAAAATNVRGETQDLAPLTIKQASDLLRSKSISPVDLVQVCLRRIEKYNSALNAFITVTADSAMAEARKAEADIRQGKWRGPLHGIPIGLKDNIDTAGVRTTGGSELFQDRIPTEDAEAARRLKNAGAILIGKLNLVEFAYGGNPTVTHYGTVHNPWKLDRTPGGSSSGPGAAVAADLCYGSLGTDTAGSIRMPASNCGIVGLKPTYGRASLRGVIPLSWTLDHIGPLSKSVEDAAILLQAIAGYDPLDTTTVDSRVPDYIRALRMSTAKLRLGRPASYFEGLHPEVAKTVDAAIQVLQSLTAGLSNVQIPAAINGARLWGPEAYLYHAPWFTKTPEKYQPAVRRSLQQYADAKASDYVAARREVDRLRREIRTVFEKVDLLITPTMVTPPPPLAGGGAAGPGRNNNAPFDVFGLPAISVPCGFSSDGLPIGLQIIGAPFAEPTVLALAHAYEQRTEWHRRRPEIRPA